MTDAWRNPAGWLLPALVGVATGTVVIAVWWLLYSVGLSTFPPFDLGDVVIRRAPGGVATWAIETLSTRAQDVALSGGLIVWVAVWAVLGPVAYRLRSALAVRFVPLVLVPVGLGLGWWSEGAPSIGRFVWLTVMFTASLLAGGVLLAYWIERLVDAQREADSPAEDWLDHPGNYQRRELLRRVIFIALGVGLGSLIAGRVVRGSGVTDVTTSASVPLLDVRSAGVSPVALPTTVAASGLPDRFLSPDGLRPRITSNAEFYVVDISTRDPNLHEMSWALRVHGLVERELIVGWRDLLAMPSIELDGTLMCISYEHDNGLISTTRWTGVPLRDVLERAGVGGSTLDLVLRGENGYSDSIPLAKALEPTTLLAYGMNGTTLPRSHGFPCRLYVPGLYGEKNVKWLREIELVDYDFLGYWQERGWTDVATVNTISIIDTPRGNVVQGAAGVPIAGIAFAGDRGISAVQVRVDNGDWLEATLEANEPSLIWQRWRFDWHPDPGNYRVTVRAIDGDGSPQVESDRAPHPDGMTGLHTVKVNMV